MSLIIAIFILLLISTIIILGFKLHEKTYINKKLNILLKQAELEKKVIYDTLNQFREEIERLRNN